MVTEDPEAIKLSLSFLDRRFNLDLDLGEFDLEIRRQHEKIAKLRERNSEIDKCIEILERGLSLGEDKQMRLAKEISELLETRGN